jgi:DMSO/TMAO reductase YedYZ molybdopterin-dependent catalytic subunit
VAEWSGVQLSHLAEMVGVDPAVNYVDFRSFDDGYWSSWDRETALHPQTLITVGMNGALLDPGHGAPARLYSSLKYGYKSVKYLTEINFLSHRTGGYWEDRGYDWYAGL